MSLNTSASELLERFPQEALEGSHNENFIERNSDTIKILLFMFIFVFMYSMGQYFILRHYYKLFEPTLEDINSLRKDADNLLKLKSILMKRVNDIETDINNVNKELDDQLHDIKKCIKDPVYC